MRKAALLYNPDSGGSKRRQRELQAALAILKGGGVEAELFPTESREHAAGLVVAPGFIDLHQHGQEPASQYVKAFDGVTTALEMEIGVPDVAAFLKMKQGQSLIHYGTTASHVAARSLIFGAPLNPGTSGPHAGIPEILPKSGPATDEHASDEQLSRIKQRLREELDRGALGIGMGIQYVPGATRLEVIDMIEAACPRGMLAGILSGLSPALISPRTSSVAGVRATSSERTA